MMKPLALHQQHEALGATFQGWGEWEVPAHYHDPVSEYEAARQQAGLADLSDRGKNSITGEDRITWLQNVISNDILPLQPGQGRYSTLMNHKGKILSYFRVLLQPDSILLEDVGEVGELTYHTLRKFLLYGTKAKLHNELETRGLLVVTGPHSPDVIQQALKVDVSPLKILESMPFSFDEKDGILARTEETGGQDYALYVPKDMLPALWSRFMETGTEKGLLPIGRQTLNTLRIEAGLARLGPDLNDKIVPPEANLEGIAFSLSKGCYPGQEVVARMDTYGSVKRRLVGLVMDAENHSLPENGDKIFSGSREVGWVTSPAYSPLLKKPVTLGYALRDFTQPQTTLEIEYQGTRVPASVSALPFTTSF